MTAMIDLESWLEDTRDAIAANGWDCVPVDTYMRRNPKTGRMERAFTPREYAEGETYPANHPAWTAAKYPTSKVSRDMFAVRLGGAVLLDIDGNKPGCVTLPELVAKMGEPLPPVPVQIRESNNSIHHLYRLPDGVDASTLKSSQDGRFAAGIDLKRGTQLIYIKRDKFLPFGTLPPLADLPPCPQPFIEQLTRKVIVKQVRERADRATGEIRLVEFAPSTTTSAYGKKLLDGICDQIRTSPSGTHNATINAGVLRVYHFVAGGEIAEDEAERELWKAARATGHAEHRIEKTFESAREAGIAEPMNNGCSADDFDVLEPANIVVMPDSDDWENPSKPAQQDAQQDAANDPDEDEKPQPAPSSFLDWRTVDVTTPPGFVGEVCRQMARVSHRPLPLAYVPGALHLVAIAMGLGKRRGMNGGKVALTTFTIAETASGKESPQEFAREVLAKIGKGWHVTSELRSDKDLLMNLLTSDAVSLYIIDEAHGFIEGVNDKRANSYTQAIAPLMLRIATASSYQLAGIHRRGIKTELATAAKDIAKRRKTITEQNAAGELDDIAFAKEIAYLDEDAADVKKQGQWLKSGIPSPVANFMLSSTPRKFEKAITSAEIDSGLLGRSLVFRIDEGRAKRNRRAVEFTAIDSQIRAVINHIADIADPEKKRAKEYTIEPEAVAMLEKIDNYFEDDARLNAPTIGGVFARGMERIYSVVSILAALDGVVTAEHVRYALALFLHSLDTVLILSRRNNARSPDEKIQMVILDKLRRGKVARSTLVRDIARISEFAEMEQTARLAGLPSPIETALAKQVEVGNIELVGRGAYQRVKR